MKLLRIVIGVVGALAVFSLGVGAGAAGLRIGWLEFGVLLVAALAVIGAFSIGSILGKRGSRR
ncbi:MAG: hypothetical protein ACOC5M_01920 [Chloroflexota bacterium]